MEREGGEGGGKDGVYRRYGSECARSWGPWSERGQKGDGKAISVLMETKTLMKGRG